MARYFDVHPDNPQPRALDQVVAVLNDGGLVAYPTDSGFALGSALGNKDALERIRRLRELDDKHHFTLVCGEFAQLGQFVQMDTSVFRAVKAATPGAYTFILPGTREVPRQMLHPKKKTVGVRVPDHVTARALADALGGPILSSTLILPGASEPLTEGWVVTDELGSELDAVLDSGDCGQEPTTVISWVDGAPEVVRRGAGDPTPFE